MDFQSGYEKAMNALLPAMSGAGVVLIHGTVYGRLTAYPVQGIPDDDIAGMVGRTLLAASLKIPRLPLFPYGDASISGRGILLYKL